MLTIGRWDDWFDNNDDVATHCFDFLWHIKMCPLRQKDNISVVSPMTSPTPSQAIKCEILMA